jgi:hypothetical protein
LHQLEAQLRRVTAELDEVVAVIDRERDWAHDRHRSVKGYLRAELNWCDHQIVDHLRAATLAGDVPQVGEALSAGTLGVAQARLFGRARANPRCGRQLTEFAGELLGFARNLPYRDFRLVIERWEQLADADGSLRQAELSHTTRSVAFSVAAGAGHLVAGGPVVQLAEMKELWERFAQAEFLADWEATVAAHGESADVSLMERTGGQRGWDALHRIFLTAAATPGGAQLPEPTLNLTMDVATYERTLARMGLIDPPAGEPIAPLPLDRWRCETRDGVVLDPVEAVAASLHGHIRRVVFASNSEVIDLGRRRRWFTGAARDAVRLTSDRCVWPGCAVSVGRCQVDHLTDWQHDGRTRSDNGTVLCGHHNRSKNHGYTIRRDPDGHWHTHRPDGSEIGVSTYADAATATSDALIRAG